MNAYGGSGEKEGRDGACTPKWLADLLNVVEWYLDPCSNPRGHVRAQCELTLEHGDNGLVENDDGVPGVHHVHIDNAIPPNRDYIRQEATRTWKVFINPPYAAGQVIRWVRHYRHTRFCFLLRWDPSTAWFRELIPHCTHVWFPSRRINFEPPPGVKFSSNPFPHALYLRDPPEELLASLAPHGLLIPLDGMTVGAHSGRHEQHTASTGDQGGTTEGGAQGGAGGAPDDDRCGWCERNVRRSPHEEGCPISER